jgi:hypothetical protein
MTTVAQLTTYVLIAPTILGVCSRNPSSCVRPLRMPLTMSSTSPTWRSNSGAARRHYRSVPISRPLASTYSGAKTLQIP